MAKFNTKLQKGLSQKKPSANLMATQKVEKPDTVNRQGFAAQSLDPWLRLISMLNTLKLEDQYYRSENETVKELRSLINQLGKENPYQVAQCIVYSRCIGEGMRSINHLASVLLAPFLSGHDWGKRFYSRFDKRKQIGGCIFRTDDMSEIMACYKHYNSKALPNSMKKGFASTIEQLDLYNFGKYTKQIRDVANMVHPNPKKTPLVANDKGVETFTALNCIMSGINIPAETWERAQSEAGEIVRQAQRDGKIDDVQAAAILQEAKAENWSQLLQEKKLGVLAALRNLRSILATNPSEQVINGVSNLFTDRDSLLRAKIMPYQIDMANEVISTEFNTANSRKLSKALLFAYENALPNLTELLSGNNLVVIDQSGSMWMRGKEIKDPNRKLNYQKLAGDKALQIGATIAKATNADVIRFGAKAEYVKYNPNQDVFSMAQSWKADMSATNLASAFELAKQSGRKYDRIFILSDNECNVGNNAQAYKNYVQHIGDPYIYSIDLAAYGTTTLAGPKVRYYFGFGYSMFDDISKSEFNPSYHLDKVKSIKI